MRATLLLLGLVACSAAHGQDLKNTFAVPGYKLEVPPTVDGTIDETTEWQGVPHFRGLHDTSSGAEAEETGQFWIGYTTEFIYFAARLDDKQPAAIRAIEYRTNVGMAGDDYVELNLDTTGSMSDFHYFQMNPRGATNMNVPGGTASKREWSGEFIAKGRITPTGWEVEAQIPWAALRLPGSGKRSLRFNVTRYISRTQRWYEWAPTANGKIDNTGWWHEVDIPAVYRPRTLKLLPYGYLGGAEGEDLIFNSGVDMKSKLNDQIDFVGTINPDFRNVENQILSLAFSRFERLAGETRPFFQEGSNYLSSRIFTSQRIRHVDVGAKFFGKIDDQTSFGLLNTRYFENEPEDDLIFNVSRSLGTNRNVGASFARLDKEDVENEAYILRYSHGVGPLYLFFRNSGTNDSIVGRGDEKLINLNYSKDYLYTYASYSQVTRHFKPRLGFAPETDYKGMDFGGGYNRPLDRGPFAEYGFWLGAFSFDRMNGDAYREGASGSFDVSLRNSISFGAGISSSEFEGSHDQTYNAYASWPRNDPNRRFSASHGWGTLADHPYRSTSLGASYKPHRDLSLSVSAQFFEHFAKDRQVIFDWGYDLHNDRSVSGRAVQSGDDWNAYAAFRRSGNTGMEYFLIYGDPNSRTFRNSLILKVSMPLEILLGPSRRPAKSGVK